MYTAADHVFMSHALQLAEKGLYTTTPNPRVGCVIVKGERIIASG
ncbi:MAG TPA: riboflavin biosynthesis protein RibD, partial [Nitrosomonas sp.]|nr:riboflavin biosynthesis protein RibD [Nitrosomonas sp.]